MTHQALATVMNGAYRYRAALMGLGVTALASLMRLTTLGYPPVLVFDEVYYARDAFSLMTQGFEGVWEGENQAFAMGDATGLTDRAAYVVHPPLGKWMIALGMQFFGPTPFGWRVSAACFGIATVVIVAFIARHIFRSTMWGAVAGIILALDGQHIVMSRHALLDVFMTFFAVVAFGLLLKDREATRRRLEQLAVNHQASRAFPDSRGLPGMGARIGPRWWRYAAIVALGLACSVKWSGLFYAIGLLALAVVWDVIDRRRAGYRLYVLGAGLRAVPTAIGSVVTIVAVYAANWWHWFASDSSYKRHWAANNPDDGVQWLPESWRSLFQYHRDMHGFHSKLDAEHSYAADPLGWIVQRRPTAFHFEDVVVEGSEKPWVSAITGLGHPMLWWVLPAILVVVAWRMIRHRDLTGLTVSVGLLAAWLPWVVFYSHRTVFTFYTVAMSPWAALMAVWALMLIARPPSLKRAWSPNGVAIIIALLGLYFVVAAFFTPLWTGQPIPYEYWRGHMWFPRNWI